MCASRGVCARVSDWVLLNSFILFFFIFHPLRQSPPPISLSFFFFFRPEKHGSSNGSIFNFLHSAVIAAAAAAAATAFRREGWVPVMIARLARHRTPRFFGRLRYTKIFIMFALSLRVIRTRTRTVNTAKRANL